MLGPMAVLAACCFFIGLAPRALTPVLGMGISAWAPELANAEVRLESLAPLGWISGMGLLLLAALLAGAILLRSRLLRGGTQLGSTWGCGYVAPSPRMQYTSSSFAQMLVRLFAWVLRPRTQAPRDLSLFPGPACFHSEVPDTVLDEAVLPAFRNAARLLGSFRVLQQGSVQTYILYILIALLALFLWR